MVIRSFFGRMLLVYESRLAVAVKRTCILPLFCLLHRICHGYGAAGIFQHCNIVSGIAEG